MIFPPKKSIYFVKFGIAYNYQYSDLFKMMASAMGVLMGRKLAGEA